MAWRPSLPAVLGPREEIERAFAVVYVVFRLAQTIQLVAIFAVGDPIVAGCPLWAASVALALYVGEFGWVLRRMWRLASYGGGLTAAVEGATVVTTLLLVGLATPSSADRFSAALWLFSPTIVMTCGLAAALDRGTATLAAVVPPLLLSLPGFVHPTRHLGLAGTIGYLTAYPVLTFGVAVGVQYMRRLGHRLEVLDEQIAAQARQEQQRASAAFLHDRVIGAVEASVRRLRQYPPLPRELKSEIGVLTAAVDDMRAAMTGRESRITSSVAEVHLDLAMLAAQLDIDLRWVFAGGILREPPTPPELTPMLFALREALYNASKHGGAHSALVRLEVNEEFLRAHVQLDQTPGSVQGLVALSVTDNKAYSRVIDAGGTVAVESDGDDAVHVEIELRRSPQHRRSP